MILNKEIKNGSKLILKKGDSALFSSFFEAVISSMSALVFEDQTDDFESTIIATADYEIIFRKRPINEKAE